MADFRGETGKVQDEPEMCYQKIGRYLKSDGDVPKDTDAITTGFPMVKYGASSNIFELQNK